MYPNMFSPFSNDNREFFILNESIFNNIIQINNQ